MATQSEHPAESSGNIKYVIIGLLLIAAAIGVWIVLGQREDTGPIGPPPPPDRPTALAEPELEIPDPEPDANFDSGPPQKRIVYRYVRSDWECDGTIDQGQASGVINSYRRQVRNCYEHQLKSNHTLQGNVSLTLRIGPDGRVSGTRVGGSLQDPTVFACVRNLAQNWQFPQPAGGCVVVGQTFAMRPQE